MLSMQDIRHTQHHMIESVQSKSQANADNACSIALSVDDDHMIHQCDGNKFCFMCFVVLREDIS
jgi:hypothetical protein